MPNKIIIGLHITAYLLIIVVNALPYIFADDDYIYDNRGFEISTICSFVVFFVCYLIFGVLVNTVVTKIVSAEIKSTESAMNASETDEERFQTERSTYRSNCVEIQVSEDAEDITLILSQLRRSSIAEGMIDTLFRQSFEGRYRSSSDIREDTNQRLRASERIIDEIEAEIRRSR